MPARPAAIPIPMPAPIGTAQMCSTGAAPCAYTGEAIIKSAISRNKYESLRILLSPPHEFAASGWLTLPCQRPHAGGDEAGMKFSAPLLPVHLLNKLWRAA